MLSSFVHPPWWRITLFRKHVNGNRCSAFKAVPLQMDGLVRAQSARGLPPHRCLQANSLLRHHDQILRSSREGGNFRSIFILRTSQFAVFPHQASTSVWIPRSHFSAEELLHWTEEGGRPTQNDHAKVSHKFLIARIFSGKLIWWIHILISEF